MTKKERIINYISLHPRCTRRQVAVGIEACYVYVSSIIAKLVKDGTLVESAASVEYKAGSGRVPKTLTIAEAPEASCVGS